MFYRKYVIFPGRDVNESYYFTRKLCIKLWFPFWYLNFGVIWAVYVELCCWLEGSMATCGADTKKGKLRRKKKSLQKAPKKPCESGLNTSSATNSIAGWVVLSLFGYWENGGKLSLSFFNFFLCHNFYEFFHFDDY